MKFLLDTNVISELRRSNPEPVVLRWFTSLSDEYKYISSITLGELNKGISKLEKSRKKTELISWFNSIQESFKFNTLPLDGDVAIKWGEMISTAGKEGRILPSINTLIAATAYIHGAILVTRNTKDFEDLPIQVLNPWL